MTSFNDTVEYCERLVKEKLERTITSAADIERFLQRYEEGDLSKVIEEDLIALNEIGNLYKHLENIQKMKTSYLSGR
jgi:hypothetical protein